MPQYKCPVCGLVVLELPAPIQFYHQAGSPYPAEPKVYCGRDGTVLAWGRGAILAEAGEVIVDGDVNPQVKQEAADLLAAREKRGESPATVDVVVNGVSSGVPAKTDPVADLPDPSKGKDKGRN